MREVLPSGLWPVMLTPFTDTNKIDLPALEELVEFYINAGSSGLFTNCLSSEMFDLSSEERLLLTKAVVDAANGRIPVISTGTFSLKEDENIRFFKRIFDTGVKAVVINSNQLNPCQETEDVFKKNLESLIRNTGNIPLGIYECPVPYKRLLSPDLLKWMADTERFVYFKDTSCDNQQIEAKLNVLKGTGFGFFNANIPTALYSLQKGGRGLSPIGANFIPELYYFLADNYNDIGKKELINKINSFLSVIDPLVHLNYPFAAKWCLQKRGLKLTTKTRTSYIPLQSQDFLRINDLLKIFEELMYEINQPV